MLFSVRGLTVRSPDSRRLLDHVSLSVAGREALVIVGPSGSGKSTLAARAVRSRRAFE